MTAAQPLQVRKQRSLITHLGCRVQVSTVYDTRTGLMSQDITMSTSEEQQAQDQRDAAANALARIASKRRTST